ncbi:putative protein CHUP1 [Helianthus annuus]|uniref:Hydroxyproline-rich glycoprotein family protein n=1 Tax=Helianthus annuus TaxID=4232 RepID=A0A251S4M0_HELAN|nr:uncharacterized protein At4g04980 [Helianthus annuus]KAF5760684.1 putative protein CHUP1 [Helianthus annuus]KAJ0438675.1 putative protein CHUP1 [Helianthus annuus]KAJ0461023.1 putative protein CHUP1 [Helianthus annuus]KAJ0641449.1 putative protein CHUP1 [Helianthus annuus]
MDMAHDEDLAASFSSSKSFMECYLDKLKVPSSPGTPTSVLPDFSSMKSGEDCSIARAIKKLSPIDVKRLSIHMYSHVNRQVSNNHMEEPKRDYVALVDDAELSPVEDYVALVDNVELSPAEDLQSTMVPTTPPLVVRRSNVITSMSPSPPPSDSSSTKSLLPPPPPMKASCLGTPQPPPPPPPLPLRSRSLHIVIPPQPPLPPPPPIMTSNVTKSLPPSPPSLASSSSKMPLPPPPPSMSGTHVANPEQPPLPPPMGVPPPPPAPMTPRSIPPPPPTPTTPRNIPLPPPPFQQGKAGAPPPPPLVGPTRSLRAKPTTKLKRSSQMGSLYRLLKGKLEGSNLDGKSLKRTGSKLGAASNGNGKQGMADALAEMTKRSSFFIQIEEDVKNYANSIKEVRTALSSFQTTDMDELIKFHKYVESHMEKLTDETQVLARFEDFPSKKLEGLRMAAALYAKLDAIATTLQNWKIESPVNQLIDKVENYFNKIKGELDTLDRTKDEELKKFKSQNIHFDFTILVRIKELMVEVSSNCMELALKETREPTAKEHQDNGLKCHSKKSGSGKTLWKAFQFAFRVYTFAGGQDDRADFLTRELAQEIQTDSHK